MKKKLGLIVEYARLLPGPEVGKFFAENGFEVIRIESPEFPDLVDELGKGLYQDLNKLKKKSPPSQLNTLLKKADGFIEGFKPETKKKLGLDWPTLRKINPRLCVLSLTGYPSGDTLSHQPGHDINFMAEAGALSLFKELPPLPFSQMVSTPYAAFQLFSAIQRAKLNRKGEFISIAFVEVMKELQRIVRVPFRQHRTDPAESRTLFNAGFPCYRIYKTKDRMLAVGALEKKYWVAFLLGIGYPELESAQYADGTMQAGVCQTIEAALLKKTAQEWLAIFSKTPCCVSLVKTYSELF